jgi:hypothetical protein
MASARGIGWRSATDRAAKGVAKHLAVFFTQQGWIAES